MTPEHLQKMQEGKKNAIRKKRPNYKLIIKGKCLDCSGQQPGEVKLCTVTSCSLHSIRPFQPKRPR